MPIVYKESVTKAIITFMHEQTLNLITVCTINRNLPEITPPRRGIRKKLQPAIQDEWSRKFSKQIFLSHRSPYIRIRYIDEDARASDGCASSKSCRLRVDLNYSSKTTASFFELERGAVCIDKGAAAAAAAGTRVERYSLGGLTLHRIANLAAAFLKFKLPGTGAKLKGGGEGSRSIASDIRDENLNECSGRPAYWRYENLCGFIDFLYRGGKSLLVCIFVIALSLHEVVSSEMITDKSQIICIKWAVTTAYGQKRMF